MSVGWLLGVEEPPQGGGADAEPATETGELTEQQLHMVEELVRQYSGTRGLSPRRRKVLKLAVAAGAVCLAGVLYSLFSRLGRLDQQYTDLQNSLYRVESGVNIQIGSISNRVEEILKAQNSLLADYGAELFSADLEENRAVFSVRAVPKTYTPGMSVIFLADNGKETLEFPAQEGENGTFSVEAPCPLTDSITLSAVFVTGDTRQTQLLDQFAYLYSESFPDVLVSDRLSIFDVEDFDQGDGTFAVSESYVTVQVDMERQPGLPRVDSVQVGLFHNKKLVQWLEPCERPANYSGFEGEDFYHSDPVTLSMEEGDRLEFAARCTDQYGRAWMATDLGYVVKNGELDYPSQYTSMSDTAEWTF